MSITIPLKRNPSQGNKLLGEHPLGDAPIILPTFAKTSLGSFEPGGDESWGGSSDYRVLRASDSFQWYQYQGGKSYAPTYGYCKIDETQGAKESTACFEIVVTGGRTNPFYYPEEIAGTVITTEQDAIDNPGNIAGEPAGGFNTYLLNEDRSKQMSVPADANRFSFYTKLPVGFERSLHHSGEPENYTMNFGTYTRDPDGSYGSGSNMGRHFYHWMNFKGNGEYWTKVIIDDHPQHEVGGSTDPGVNPTSGDGFPYMSGLTRIYYKSTANLIQPPYSVYVDQAEVYNDPRPMPQKIATICLTPHSLVDFDIDFVSEDQGAGDSFVHTFEVRYSTNPIDETNFYDLPIAGAPDGVNGFTGDWERYCHFELRGMDISGADVVYFAIRQLDENSTLIAYAEYEWR